MDIIIALGIFITLALFIEGVLNIFWTVKNSEQKRVRKRLDILEGTSGKYEVDITRRKIFSEIPWLNKLLFKATPIIRLSNLIEQANSRFSPGFFILLSFMFVSTGYAAGLLMKMNSVVTLITALLLGAGPFLYLKWKKQQRMSKFTEQLPETLDLVSRALKAGHAFNGGLKMVADEFADPVGTEFGKTVDEINFGVSVEDALKNLSSRVDSQDLRFFIISVLIQRETGGNLAEILEKIASLIRARFKLFGHVRTLAAEGKLSAVILVLLPPVMAFYFFLVRPDYIMLLFEDRLGIMMASAAAVMMSLGIWVMKKMVTIRV